MANQKEDEKKSGLSLFNRILVGAGLAEAEGDTGATPAETPAVASVPAPASNDGHVSGMIDQKMRATLMEAVVQDQTNNPKMHGIDAFEYSKGLKMAQGATLQSRAQFAFDQAKAFATSPLTKKHLKDTLGEILGVLQTESDNFESALGAKIQSQVGPQQAQLDALEKENAEIDAQMEALKAKKSENIAKINELGGEVHTLRSNLDQTAANFQVTLEDVIKEYQEVQLAIDTLPEDGVAQ